MFDRTHDARVRSADFEWLADQVMRYGDVLPRKVLEQGFFMDDVRVPFVGPLAYFNGVAKGPIESSRLGSGFMSHARKPQAFKPGDEWHPGAKRRPFIFLAKSSGL